MKKILFMASSMNIGGVEKSLLSLLSVIPKEKYEITLLLLEKKGGFLNDLPDWIKVEEASWFKKVKPIIMQPPQQTIKDYYNNKEFFKIPAFTASYILSEKLQNRYMYYQYVLKEIPKDAAAYDVAIAYQGPTDIIDCYIANKVKAKKKVSWVHFDVSKHPINQKLYSKIYKKMDKIFVVSEEAKKRLIQKIPALRKKAEVFLNIISSDFINKLALEPIEFDNGFQGAKVVTVGRLSKEKGQDLAIKVLSRLIKEGVSVRWYCIGEGNSRKEYERLISQYGLKNDFILIGQKANPYPYIANADIYVQTSRHEGYCLTLAEARCLRKPIVTTNFTGAFEQLVNGHDGFIVNFSEEELYEKIKLLIEMPEKKAKLASNLARTDVETMSEASKFFTYVS